MSSPTFPFYCATAQGVKIPQAYVTASKTPLASFSELPRCVVLMGKEIRNVPQCSRLMKTELFRSFHRASLKLRCSTVRSKGCECTTVSLACTISCLPHIESDWPPFFTVGLRLCLGQLFQGLTCSRRLLSAYVVQPISASSSYLSLQPVFEDLLPGVIRSTAGLRGAATLVQTMGTTLVIVAWSKT